MSGSVFLLERARAALAVTVLALAVAACGGDDGTTTPTSPTAAATTTSTLPPTTNTIPPTTTAAPTTTTEPSAPVYPLTGLPVTDPAVAARPTLVVKIDNAKGARPQTGFNSADMVVEEIVNDSLTRFAMVFHSGGSDPVGPIRSGRLQDIDLFGMFNRPLFAWSGGNSTVEAAIGSSDLTDIRAGKASGYFRAEDREVPHNLYSNTSKLWENAALAAGPPAQQFEYRVADDPLQGVPSPGVDVTLDSIDVGWTWDPGDAVYRRTMEGKDHDDRAGGQVTTHNVIVFAVEYAEGISGSPDALTIGVGEVFVFTGGNYIHGLWSRANRLQPFRLTADNGTEITLTPGRSFIELPRPGNTTPRTAG